jgi:predicted nucleic acid-binding protein
MSGRAFLDTNVLVYAAVAPGDPRGERARALLAGGGVWSVGVLNEFVAAARKLRTSWVEVRVALAYLEAICPEPAGLTLQTHRGGVEIAQRYGYHIFDALVIAAALEAGCATLYSEDMQDGQRIEGLTIRNPFRS